MLFLGHTQSRTRGQVAALPWPCFGRRAAPRPGPGGAGGLAPRHDSPLWKLKTMVDEAAVGGKDLVADMVRRLKRDILVTTNRLDAMRPR